MPSLKEYRDRISSVKSTKKITSAMKMVAASKLKKAQDQAEASQPYARAIAQMMDRVSRGVTIGPHSPKLLIGTGRNEKHLLIVFTADRGLCGGFNANMIRAARLKIGDLQAQGKDVKLIVVGRKGRDAFRRSHKELVLKNYAQIGNKNYIPYEEADQIAQYVLGLFEDGEFDICHLFYNNFKSVLIQRPRLQQLIPFSNESVDTKPAASEQNNEKGDQPASPYEFEPDEETILKALLPRNIGVQIYRALLDSAAGEQAARMTAMDSATRNAGDMIKSLSLEYNRARQAQITKELIEIISGAEAV